ncbi:unnamed protein product, partial [Oppiella nova]
GIEEVHKLYHDDYDWLYKADDDTYTIMENLVDFVSRYNTSDPLWFGQPFRTPWKNNKQYYFTGGAGYLHNHKKVFSKEAVNRLIKSFENRRKDCDVSKQEGPDDVYFAVCLQGSGVVPGDARDVLGEPRFFHFSPETMMNPNK